MGVSRDEHHSKCYDRSPRGGYIHVLVIIAAEGTPMVVNLTVEDSLF